MATSSYIFTFLAKPTIYYLTKFVMISPHSKNFLPVASIFHSRLFMVLRTMYFNDLLKNKYGLSAIKAFGLKAKYSLYYSSIF